MNIRRRPGLRKWGFAAERDDREALDQTPGRYESKACVIADGAGRAIAFRIAPGQAHELPHVLPLLNQLPSVPRWVVADRGYSSQRFRQHVLDAGAKPAISSKRNEAPARCSYWIYTNRNIVERLWVRLREWPAVATRYEKTATSFSGVLCLAAALDHLR